MDKLFLLLRELIGYAVPQGNRRGELLGLVDEIERELSGAVQAPSPAPQPRRTPPPRFDGPPSA